MGLRVSAILYPALSIVAAGPSRTDPGRDIVFESDKIRVRILWTFLGVGPTRSYINSKFVSYYV